MAGEDDDVIVHIDDAVLGDGAEVGKKPPEKIVKVEGDGKNKGTDDPLEDLRSQFTTLQNQVRNSDTQKAEAIRIATEANQRTAALETELKQTTSTNQLEAVVNGLSAAESEAQQAEKDYKTAFDAGDGAAAAAAQRRIARAESSIARLTEAKAELDTAERAAPRQEQRNEAPQQRQHVDPVEAYIQNRTEPTKNWLRAHVDYITDPMKNAKLTAAHYDAVAGGLDADTPEYFEHVEKFVGLKKADPQQRQRRPASQTLPVGHTGGGVNGGAREVRLTHGEATSATDGTHVWGAHDFASGRIKEKSLIGAPIGVQEMARRKLELQKEGRYDRAYLES